MDVYLGKSEDGIAILIDKDYEYVFSYENAVCFAKGLTEPPIEAAKLEYVVVMRERGSANRYMLVDAKADKLVYSKQIRWASLKDTLHWVSEWITGRSRIPTDYSFYELKAKNDATLDWIASYMPSKRKRTPDDVRAEVYAKCDGHCAYCGKPLKIEEMQVDHVQSHYRHKGSDEVDNFLPSCRDCNGLKSDYDLEEFRSVRIPECAKHRKEGESTRHGRIAIAYKLNPFSKKRIEFYFEKKGDKNGI